MGDINALRLVLGNGAELLTPSLPDFDERLEPRLTSRCCDGGRFRQWAKRGGAQLHLTSHLDRGPVLPQSVWNWLRRASLSKSHKRRRRFRAARSQKSPPVRGFHCVPDDGSFECDERCRISSSTTIEISDYPHEWGIVSQRKWGGEKFGSRPRRLRQTLLHLPTQQVLLTTHSQEVTCPWASAGTVAHGMSINVAADVRYRDCLPCLVARRNGVPDSLDYFVLHGPVTNCLLRQAVQLHLPQPISCLTALVIEFCYGTPTPLKGDTAATAEQWLQSLMPCKHD